MLRAILSWMLAYTLMFERCKDWIYHQKCTPDKKYFYIYFLPTIYTNTVEGGTSKLPIIVYWIILRWIQKKKIELQNLPCKYL